MQNVWEREVLCGSVLLFCEVVVVVLELWDTHPKHPQTHKPQPDNINTQQFLNLRT